MRIAVCLRGISYQENYLHKYNLPRYTIDFRDTCNSIRKHVIDALQECGHEVNVYCLTYHSKMEQELLDYYKPVGYEFKNYEQMHLGEDQVKRGYPLMLDYMVRAIDMVGDQADFIIVTRFDLLYYQSVTEIGLDFGAINFPFYHYNPPICGNEDNLICFPASKKEVLRELCVKMRDNSWEERRKIWLNTHNLGEYLLEKGEPVKYLFGEKKDGAYDYPIYKFGRHLFGAVREFSSLEEILKRFPCRCVLGGR